MSTDFGVHVYYTNRILKSFNLYVTAWNSELLFIKRQCNQSKKMKDPELTNASGNVIDQHDHRGHLWKWNKDHLSKW